MATVTNLLLSAPLTSQTFVINSNTGNETGFSGLTSGSAVVSSVSGTSGVFTPSSWGNAPWLMMEFNAGGAFTPGVAGALIGWLLQSQDGGTTYETSVGTPSTTQPYLARSPDFVFSLINVAYASGNRVAAVSWVRVPPFQHKFVVQNMSGANLPTSTTNWIKAMGVTINGTT